MNKMKRVVRVFGWTGGLLLILYKLFYSKLQAFKSSLELLEWAERNQSNLKANGRLVVLEGLPHFPEKMFAFRPFSSDSLVVRQHFFSHELQPVVQYFRRSGRELRKMIDAGGNIGASACYMHWRFPEMKSLVLEPSQANFEVVKVNLNDYSAEIWQKALWWRSEMLSLDESKSAWAIKVSRNSNNRKTGVEGIALSKILSGQDFAHPDYIKIDIEGAEEEVFEKDESLGHFLGQVSCISVEPHSEKGRLLIERKLAEWGYRIEHHGELVFGFR